MSKWLIEKENRITVWWEKLKPLSIDNKFGHISEGLVQNRGQSKELLKSKKRLPKALF